jgi:hypothetical protein
LHKIESRKNFKPTFHTRHRSVPHQAHADYLNAAALFKLGQIDLATLERELQQKTRAKNEPSEHAAEKDENLERLLNWPYRQTLYRQKREETKLLVLEPFDMKKAKQLSTKEYVVYRENYL